MDKLELNPYSARSSQSQTPEKTASRLKQLQREINHYRQLMNKKDDEIQYLSSKNNQLLLSKSAAGSKNQMDNIYESSLQDQINRLNSKLADKTKEYERLYQKHSTLENDFATLEDFTADLDRERKFLADKLANIEIHTEGDEIVGELENKLVLMSTEIMRLGQLARNKTQQNNDLRFKVKSQEQQLEQVQNELGEKQKTLTQYRDRIRNLQKKQLELESTKDYENQSTYKILSLEIERLNVLLHNKIEEIGSLQHRNKVLQDRINLNNSNVDKRNYGQLEIEVQRLNKVNMLSRQDIEQLENEVKKVRRENKDIGDENQKCRRTIKKLEEELEQTRKSYIKNQNEKIRIEVETSERTIRQQKSTIQKLQKQAQAFNEQRQQQIKTKFEEEVNKLKAFLQKSQSKCTSLCNDLMRYEEKLVMLSQEVQRLSLQNNKYQQQNADLKRLQYKVETKERQLKEIQRTRESAYAEMKRDKNQIDRLKSEVKQLWEKNRDFESKQYQLRSLSEELQIVTQKLSSKQRQCKFLEQKIQEVTLRSSGARAQNLEVQLQSQRKSFRLKQEEASYFFEKQIQTFKDTVAKLEARIKELSSSQSSTESNYAILAQEIRRLNEVLSESSQTILTQKRNINLLENNLQTAQMSLEKMKSSHYTNEKVEEQIQRRCQIYNKEVALHQQENNNLKNKIHEISTNYTMVEHQLHTARMNLQDAKQALKNKELELRDLIEDVRSKKKNEDSLLMLIKEIKQSNLRLERKLAEIEQDYIRRMEQKSEQKQKLEREYIQYNRKVREAESQTTNLKFEVSSLQSKLDVLTRQQRQHEIENQRLRSRLDDQMRDKTSMIKLSTEEYKQKISEYEREVKKNAKALGELEADNNNKTNQIYRLETSIRQLEQERYRMQEQNRQLESQKRRDIELKSQEVRYSLDQKQVELSNLRLQILSLQQQIRNKDAAIQSKSQLIYEYENKLAMLSQELERINTIVYNKNVEMQELSEKISKAQQSASRQGKETIQIFTIQITRLNTTLCDSLEQIRELEQDIQNKNRELTRAAELNKKNEQVLKDKIFELEQQNQKNVQSNHKMAANASVLLRKIEDLQMLESENQDMKSKLMQSNSQKNKMKNMIADLESQIERLTNGYQKNLRQQKNSLASKASLQLTELQEEKKQLQRKVTMLVSENEQLVSQIQNLRRELQMSDEQSTNTKKELIRTKNQMVNLSREKQKYRLINEEVMSKVEKISINRTTEYGQNEAYELHVKHLQSIIAEYQTQIMGMKQEMEKIPNRSRQNSSVGSSNTARNSSLGKAGSEIQQKYNILESMHLKLKRQADGLREKVAEYQLKMKKLKGQFDLITKLTHEYKQENDYLRANNHSQCIYVGKMMQNQAVSMPSSNAQGQQINGKNQDMLIKQTLASEIDRLGIINGNLKREIEDLRIKASDNQSIKSRYEQLLAIFVLTVAEVEALRIQRPQ